MDEKFFAVVRKSGQVVQQSFDAHCGEEDLWLWVDEVSGESRKTLTVMTHRQVLEKWGAVVWRS